MTSTQRSSVVSDQISDKDRDIEKGEDDATIPLEQSSERIDPTTIGESETKDGQNYDREAFKVKWEPDDKENPHNFSTAYKAWVTAVLGMLAMAASLGSAIISPAEEVIAETFGVSQEVTILGVSLYVLGFAFGPCIWAPISELYGRKISLMPALFGLGIFSIATATSQTLASIFITRFFGGFFGSAPVSNVSAAIGDMYTPKARGIAVTFYAVAVVGGPCFAPVIGSALTSNPSLGWRWTEYILAIWVFTVMVLGIFGMPELYAPVLLMRKAKRLRKETGDQRWWHPQEKHKVTVKEIVTKHFSRPAMMLTTEPMVTAIAIYASFVYALLYMSLEIIPYVFAKQRQWGPVTSTLPFLGLFVGVLGAVGINLANTPRYARLVDQNGGKAVPEGRLQPMVVGAVIFTIGLFWFGWTADPAISWISPVFATAFIGAGFNVIFQQCINFLIDTYAQYAASAVSANTLLRSVMAAGLPFVVNPMLNNIGVGPGVSILGGLAALAIPVPFIFMKYGVRLRGMSKFTASQD